MLTPEDSEIIERAISRSPVANRMFIRDRTESRKYISSEVRYAYVKKRVSYYKESFEWL